MHENAPILEASQRERTGSRHSRRVRQAGKLPAVLYGHGEQPLPISLDAKETITLISKGEKVFQMKVEGAKETQVALLKDIQFDYLGTNIVHADFARVDLDERVRNRVHIKLIGNAKGVGGGSVLMHPTAEIEIECKVSNIPEEIEVDVTELDKGDVITAADVKLPGAEMILLSDPGAIVAQLAEAKAAPTDEESEVTATDGAEPEVITEKKEEEEKKD